MQKHSTPTDCWVVLHDKVYDLTAFAPVHPGGTGVIYRAAGHDATAIFAPLHPVGIEERLDAGAYIGDVDVSTLPPKPVAAPAEEGERKIPLEEIIGIPDLDDAARRNLSAKAWAYISAGATDMHCR